MRQHAWTVAIVGSLAVRAGAADPVPSYQPAPSYLPNGARWTSHSWAGMTAAGRDANGSCGCCGEGAGGESRQKGDRLGKLLDFLLYRPLPGCDCCPQTTEYVPPLHAWFPPCCHANGGEGCSTGCSKCGLKKRSAAGGCATCDGSAGTPLHVAAAKPAMIERKPGPFATSTMTGLPQPPVASSEPSATRYWMPGVPTSGSASPYSPSSKPANDGSKIQPSSYLPPLPR